MRSVRFISFTVLYFIIVHIFICACALYDLIPSMPNYVYLLYFITVGIWSVVSLIMDIADE
jgi:hypothetical protein